MKLKCLIGSLSCDGVLVEKGDVFELPDDVATRLVKDGDVEIVEEPIKKIFNEQIEELHTKKKKKY